MTGKKNKESKAKQPSKKKPQIRRSTARKNAVSQDTTHDSGEDVTVLFDRIAAILEQAQARVVQVANTEMVLAYWQTGREIVEHLQEGDERAGYGKKLIEDLSKRLCARFGRGYSSTNLRYFRTFFMVYSTRKPEIRHIKGGELLATGKGRGSDLDRIRHIGCGELPGTRNGDSGDTDKIRHSQGDVLNDMDRAVDGDNLQGFSSRLGWSHYRALMKVENEPERRFYEIEAEQEGWSVEQLERQIHTQLFARLLKSRDKAGVMDLASRGQVLERPIDAMKNPYVLDFLQLPEAHQVRERDIESAILEKLQHFLLELGKGFAFIARQKRITFEDEHFYIDLVFYNIILKCHLLVDLKIGKLTHQDVGQMDGYVRLYDDQYRTEGDNPTIGLILCAEKNEAMARYSVLHGHEQLFAAKYVTYLPSEEELARELAREKARLETSHSEVKKNRMSHAENKRGK
jgi:predicted nuclease of restriction endonuclease-like (RecB) superfamily